MVQQSKTTGNQGMSTDRRKLSIATSSSLYKLTFFPTDCQTNLPQIRVITIIEELHENSIVL